MQSLIEQMIVLAQDDESQKNTMTSGNSQCLHSWQSATSLSSPPSMNTRAASNSSHTSSRSEDNRPQSRVLHEASLQQ